MICDDAISVIRMIAHTGASCDHSEGHQKDSAKTYLRITDIDGNNYDARITGSRQLGSAVTHDFEKSHFSPPLECLDVKKIEKVQLTTRDRDGWLVASVSTYYSQDNKTFHPLTENPDLYKFIDGDQVGNYRYDARNVILTKKVEIGKDCISELQVFAKTGSRENSQFIIL